MNCDCADDVAALRPVDIGQGLAEFVCTIVAEELDGVSPPIFFES